ncbi:retrovirus-related Pol polyprotein from transposon 412 [Trichonephila clavipes]|uniref:Retrovirus-related Pol polyprotein from transposon 412 n=1 Tax=Trichonephila clavipes TaxID=2585209 RepID=A0A8X6W1H1_TRICX|nr:retrovirus-related Pol polyprotein from transposon 412 [Trichonephila clavipes]
MYELSGATAHKGQDLLRLSQLCDLRRWGACADAYEGYEEEFVKNLYETIIANGKRLEELERAEKMRLEELERAEKMRLEELVKEQALKEKELQLKFDLERFKIESGFRNLGYNFLPVEILNAVQTRSQVKAAREERGIDSGDGKKGEDEVIIVSSDAEDEILIPALQEYVPELALLRVTRENLINAQKNSEEIKPLYEQAASQVQVTNQEVFTKLNIDACGPLPITSKRNRYLITAICMSSKFPEAIPVSDISSCSDYQVFERFGILVRHSSVYHPQSNPVERFHRTLKRLLRVLCLDAGSEWDKHLPSILFSVTNCIARKYRVYTVRVGVWEKFANPRDVSNGTLDGTGRRG